MSSIIQQIRPDSLDYPEQILEVMDEAPVLYVKGNLEILKHEKLLAVVGSRRISAYGISVMRRIVREVVDSGLITVSGMAYGVDGLAHTISIESDVPTIAVLAGGLDDPSIYPREHLALSKKIIAAGGCLISEYPPGTRALRHQFVARNRIIAALAKASFIVEAAKKSGALITAGFALDYNRDVLAAPGPIFNENSVGVNKLIKQGAKMVTEAQDILEIYGLNITPKQKELPIVNSTEAAILKLLRQEALATDEMAVRLQVSASTILSTLTHLEMKGLITKTNQGEYVNL